MLFQKICVVILSLLVFVSYLIIPKFFPAIPVSQLWGGITNRTAKYIYIISITLSAVAFLLILSFFLSTTQSNKTLFWSLCGFLCFSLLWMPCMYLSRRYPAPKQPYQYISVVILGIVAFFALCIFFAFYQLTANTKNTTSFLVAALVSSAYLFFHTFFLDFILFTFADTVKNTC